MTIQCCKTWLCNGKSGFMVPGCRCHRKPWQLNATDECNLGDHTTFWKENEYLEEIKIREVDAESRRGEMKF